MGVCPVPGLQLPSLGSGGAGPSREPPLDLGAVPVAEMMDNLKSYTPRCEIKDLRNNINQYRCTYSQCMPHTHLHDL